MNRIAWPLVAVVALFLVAGFACAALGERDGMLVCLAAAVTLAVPQPPPAGGAPGVLGSALRRALPLAGLLVGLSLGGRP